MAEQEESQNVLPDSCDDSGVYMIGQRAMRPPGNNASQSTSGERSTVKSCVSQLEKKLRMQNSSPPQSKSCETADAYYTNIPRVLAGWQRSENIRHEKKVALLPLNGQHESEVEHELAQYEAKRLKDSYHEEISSNEDELLYKQQDETARNKQLGDGGRAKNRRTVGLPYWISNRGFCRRSKDKKIHQTTSEKECTTHYDHENCRGDEGIIVAGSPLNLARTLLTYLEEVLAMEDMPSYENDIKTLLGLTDMLRRHQKEIQHRKQAREYEDEETPMEPGRLETRKQDGTQGSLNFASLRQQERHSASEDEEEFSHVIDEIEYLGEQRLAGRRKLADVESGSCCISSTLTKKSKVLLLLILFFIIVFWTHFIYFAIEKRYIYVT